MVQKVEVTLIDDLDGSTAEGVVIFGLDGKSYEIDLSAANAETLRKTLARYVDAALKVGSTRGAGHGARAKAMDTGPNTAEVREWAKNQGLAVPDRGRLAKDLLVQFQEARA